MFSNYWHDISNACLHFYSVFFKVMCRSKSDPLRGEDCFFQISQVVLTFLEIMLHGLGVCV